MARHHSQEPMDTVWPSPREQHGWQGWMEYKGIEKAGCYCCSLPPACLAMDCFSSAMSPWIQLTIGLSFH